MTYEEAMQDISIAKKALADVKLDMTVSDDLLCEVYCLTPFYWQTFYLRVYDGTEYTLQYVKPYIKNALGIESVSITFDTVLKAEVHSVCEGKFICGLKKFKKDNPIINSLIQCLPLVDEIHEPPMLAIDGITNIVINKALTPETTLFFRSEEKEFCNNKYPKESVEFLNNLFVHIEKLIGNAANRDKTYLNLRELYY